MYAPYDVDIYHKEHNCETNIKIDRRVRWNSRYAEVSHIDFQNLHGGRGNGKLIVKPISIKQNIWLHIKFRICPLVYPTVIHRAISIFLLLISWLVKRLRMIRRKTRMQNNAATSMDWSCSYCLIVDSMASSITTCPNCFPSIKSIICHRSL